MTELRSFLRQPDNRRSIFLNLAGSIESQLRQAFGRRHEEIGLTQAQLATKLDVDRSVINRRLSGASNMTIETIADMVWGLGHCVRVEIFDPEDQDKSNAFRIVPAVEPAAIAISKHSNVKIIGTSLKMQTLSSGLAGNVAYQGSAGEAKKLEALS